MLAIEGFEQAWVDELRTRARDTLLKLAIEAEEKLENVADDLKNLEGIDDDMLRDLATAEINTRDELAELSLDELIEITGITEAQAQQIIMAARAHWFNDNQAPDADNQ